MKLPGTSCDVLVVGNGAAGCLASTLLARRGYDVCMVSRGATSTSLSTSRTSLSGVPRRKEVTQLLRGLGAAYGLFGSNPGREEGITSLGSIMRQDLSSPHDWLRTGPERTAVLGLKGNTDLDPDLLCRMVGKYDFLGDCRPYWADLGLPTSIDAGGGPTITRESRVAVEELAETISEMDEETVIIPPLFLGPRHDLALSILERSSGRFVREAATPLSNPGRRLQACLEHGALDSGCRLLRDRQIIGSVAQGDGLQEVRIMSGLREGTIRFRALVLATGNIVSGGLQVGCDGPYDPVFDLAIDKCVTGSLRSTALTSALSAGIRNHDGRAIRKDGSVMQNVWVAGSACPGLSYPLGKGLGHVASSSLTIAEMVGESL
ncbi:MAG: anaerobic glycerol-3-phosphate dehydrogenase subunit B [Methanomassiliicoccales archaeon PtaB.Bin134]|nr:MAG: anaerobic glycerol-3-phosphate dehydrogenase subunit B [Methanomassiliicoccales archaeon PtaB.Bin134]